MEFYRVALGGTLDLQTMNEQGQSKPAGPQDRVTYARLEAEGAVIIASDGHPDYPAKVGNNMAIVLGGTDKVRLTRIFNTLAEGGRIQMPLTKQPWGADVGWLADKFGIIWTIKHRHGVATPNGRRTQRRSPLFAPVWLLRDGPLENGPSLAGWCTLACDLETSPNNPPSARLFA